MLSGCCIDNIGNMRKILTQITCVSTNKYKRIGYGRQKSLLTQISPLLHCCYPSKNILLSLILILLHILYFFLIHLKFGML